MDSGAHGDERSPLPPASVVISSRNRPTLLTDAVQSILRGDDVPAEIIVIDQSDHENATLARLESDRGCAVRYIWTATPGVSRGRNLGLAQSRCDLVAFTDDDMLATPTWFRALIAGLVRLGPRAVVTGQVRPEVEGAAIPAIKVDEVGAVYRGRVGKDVLYSNNMALYRSVGDVVGTFDQRLGPGTRFPGAEDSDFGFRLLEAGYSIVYLPEAVMYHRAWRSEREYLRLRWSYGVGRGAFYAKHVRAGERYMLQRLLADVRVHLMGSFARAPRDRQRAYGNAALAAGLVVGAVRWLLTERATRWRGEPSLETPSETRGALPQ